MSRSRVSPKRERSATAKPCDGTVQDYRRHSYYGEDPCPASREEWRKAHRFYDNTNIYANREKDDALTVHPFFYRKPKRQYRRRKPQQ